jgi:hypothetical protein
LPKFENLKSWHEIVQNSFKLPKLIIKYFNLFIGGVLSFEFEKLSSNSSKSQCWRAFMTTASENSHHWRSLKSPACGKDHR